MKILTTSSRVMSSGEVTFPSCRIKVANSKLLRNVDWCFLMNFAAASLCPAQTNSR